MKRMLPRMFLVAVSIFAVAFFAQNCFASAPPDGYFTINAGAGQNFSDLNLQNNSSNGVTLWYSTNDTTWNEVTGIINKSSVLQSEDLTNLANGQTVYLEVKSGGTTYNLNTAKNISINSSPWQAYAGPIALNYNDSVDINWAVGASSKAKALTTITAPVPIPPSALLLGSGLLGLVGFGLRRQRNVS